MKHINVILFLAVSALAAPTGDDDGDRNQACTFGTYQCTPRNTGIDICDISGRFVLVGDCPKGTSCQELPQNGFDLPFCTNDAKKPRSFTTDQGTAAEDTTGQDSQDTTGDDTTGDDTTGDDTTGQDITGENTAAQDKPHDDGRKHDKNRPRPGDRCRTPGRYDCFGRAAIQVCDVSHILRLVGNCPQTSHCAYINDIPYCVV